MYSLTAFYLYNLPHI